MGRRVLTLLVACGSVFVPLFVFASPVMTEVLFDPTGTDTGLEAIKIMNPDSGQADLSGWELYPDGVGYFIFPPNFFLAPGASVVVHLRASGSDSPQDLYHSSASANMGNSSGSLALFKAGGRSDTTIVDFVRYHKPGSSERKTWESSAASAGLWVAGEFIDVAASGEGSSIGLVVPGVRGSAGAWKIYNPSTLAVAGGGGGGSPGVIPPAASPQTPGGASSMSDVKPSLGADAGADVTVLAGAEAAFLGAAYGLNGEPLQSGVRYLWNFGDGATREGRSVGHVYRFPGTYRANLAVSSGEYSGSDWRTVTVVLPKLSISEVMPGADGFVELENGSPETIDIGSLVLDDGVGHMFRAPARTAVAGNGVIVFANEVTGLQPRATLTLRDAGLTALESVSLPAVSPPPGGSWERRDGTFFAVAEPTPGRVASPVAVSSSSVRTSQAPSAKIVSPSATPQQLRDAPAVVAEAVMPRRDAAAAPESASAALSGFLRGGLLLVLAIAGSLAAAFGFFFLKRRLIP